jgi:HSP20 family protein
MASDVIRIKQTFFFLPAAQTVSEPVWRPPTDIYRTRDGWLVKFDLAGVRPEDVKLEVSGNQLRVSGVRRDFCLEEGCRHYQMEISYSHIERQTTLPVSLEHAKLSVENREGMLLVHLHEEAPQR